MLNSSSYSSQTLASEATLDAWNAFTGSHIGLVLASVP